MVEREYEIRLTCESELSYNSLTSSSATSLYVVICLSVQCY